MNIQVEKEDIISIGNTAFNENGYLNIVCDIKTYAIEGIVLRNILQCFGQEYKIIDKYPMTDAETNENLSEDIVEMVLVTNLPYHLYNSLMMQ